MGTPKSVIKKIIVCAVGIPLLVVGIILVPLPGPGLLICFLGLYILSLEFSLAEKHLAKFRRKLHELYLKSKERADKVEAWGDKKAKK